MAWAPLNKPEIERLLGTRPVARTEHFALHRHPRAGLVSELSTEDAPERDGSVDNIVAQAAGCGFAALVPKRHAKRAVTRNLIRRQMREAWRHDTDTSAGGHVLIRLRAGFDSHHYRSAASSALRMAVRQELSALLAQRQDTSWR